MKKVMLACAIFSSAFSFSQVINQTITWPDATWTITGTYTATGVLSEPTTGNRFTYDDNAAGAGSIDQIMATSPITNLSVAYAAGEGELTIAGTGVFNTTTAGGDALAIEYYDADSSIWRNAYTFTAIPDPLGLGLYQNCTGALNYSATIDFANFSPNNLANFQFRFKYDDNGGQQRGFCVNPPTVSSASACETPSGGTASNILDTVADLSWTENGTATTWLVDIVTAGSAPTRAGTSVTANPYSAQGLTENTAYEYYVASSCGANNSTYAGPFAFTTLQTVICNDPTNLSANSITDVTATLLWTENGTATLYDIELIDSTATPSGTPTDQGVTNPFQVSSLNPNTAYQYFVRSQCTGSTSGWTGPHYFRTGNTTTCAQPTALGANNLTTSEAELFWTENGGATSWDIEIVDLGSTPSGTPTHAGVTNPYTVTGLNQDFDYEFYVRADCGSEQSFYSGPFSFTTISGLEEVNINDFTLSPNPSSGIITLSLREQNENTFVLVQDASGRTLETIQATKTDIIIDLKNQNTGVYLITVKTEKGSTTKRLIKQ